MAEAQRTPEERQLVTMLRWLLYLVFIVIGFLMLRVLGPVLTPLLAAAAVAYLLDGAVDRLAARGVPRTAAVGGMLLGFIAIVVALLVVVVPIISQELTRFAVALPGLVERTAAWLATEHGIEVPDDWQAFLKGQEFRSFLEDAVGPVSRAAAAAVGGVFGFLGWLAELLLVPVFAFYFLVDWDQIVARAHAFVPPRHRVQVAEVAREIDQAVSGWVRGQLMVMAALAALYAVAFKIIGLHLGVTVGIVAGLLSIIPFLGVFVGAALAGLMLVLDWQGPQQLLAVGAVFLVMQVVEAVVLTPRLVGKRVGLGEVGALFAVLAGGQLLGFAGVLLAVPIAASVAVLVRRALRYYEASAFFTEGAELEVAAAAAAAQRVAPEVVAAPRGAEARPVLDPLAVESVAGSETETETDTVSVPETETEAEAESETEPESVSVPVSASVTVTERDSEGGEKEKP